MRRASLHWVGLAMSGPAPGSNPPVSPKDSDGVPAHPSVPFGRDWGAVGMRVRAVHSTPAPPSPFSTTCPVNFEELSTAVRINDSPSCVRASRGYVVTELTMDAYGQTPVSLLPVSLPTIFRG